MEPLAQLILLLQIWAQNTHTYSKKSKRFSAIEKLSSLVQPNLKLTILDTLTTGIFVVQTNELSRQPKTQIMRAALRDCIRLPLAPVPTRSKPSH